MIPLYNRDHSGGSRPGPRAVTVFSLALVGLGSISTYTGPQGRPGPIFFFFIPVSVAAVVLGRVAGVIMAVIAIAAAMVPGLWLGFGRVAVDTDASGARVASVVTWAFFLIVTAFVVGWVAERGGSIRLSRGMAGRAIRALEIERLRMGQDIHDGISQYAAAASFEAEVLSRRLEDAEPETKRQLLHLKQSLDSLVEESRGMVGNLRPPSLTPDRFDRALAQLVRDFSARTGVQSDLELVGDISVCGDAARITIYRTVQEALANIERHADAKLVKVTVQGGRKDCQVVVQDDGVGFDVEMWKTERVGHYGIAGMKERARALGGWVRIVSGSEDGTRVVLNIPSCRGDGRA